MASSTLSQIMSFLSGDLLFLLVAFILLLIFSLYGGRGRMISLILAYYPASLLFGTLPFIEKLLILQDKMLVVNKIAIFLIFLVPISIVINSYIFSESMYSGSAHFIRVGGLALLALILLVSFSYTTVNYDVFHNFGDSVDVLFNPLSRAFYWNTAIFVALAFM